MRIDLGMSFCSSLLLSLAAVAMGEYGEQVLNQFVACVECKRKDQMVRDMLEVGDGIFACFIHHGRWRTRDQLLRRLLPDSLPFRAIDTISMFWDPRSR